jgi:hypothetical protein
LGGIGGYIYALDLKTGRKIWEFKAESNVYEISIKDYIVILGCGHDADIGYAPVYALDLETGDKIWEFKAKKGVYEISIKDDIVVLGFSNKYTYALNLKTGGKIWEFRAEKSVDAISIKDDIVVLGCGKYTYALNLRTGNEIWEFKAESNVKAISIKDDIVILGCKEGYTYAFDFNVIKNYSIIQTIKQPLTNSLTNLLNQTKKLFEKSSISNIKTVKNYLNLAEEELSKGNLKQSYEYLKLSEEELIKTIVSLPNYLTLSNSSIQKIQKIKEDRSIIYEILNEISQIIQIIQQPVEINLTLLKKSFNLNEWDELPIQITNKSLKHITIKNITLPTDEFEFKTIKPIEIKGNETETIPLYIKPNVKGKLPIDIVIEFEDKFNNQYKQTFEEILTITKGDLSKTIEPEEIKQPSDFTPKPLSLTSLPPELAINYKDIELIGQGGFARVFKGVRVKDNLPVAIKIPISLDISTGKSFIKELENWTKLNHPNIVKVYDYNILPIPYFEMELCDESLWDYLKRNKVLDIKGAFFIIFNISEGLKHAHSENIIHRDLKPQNILLKNGIPKISDWGLSKVIAQSTSTTKGGFTPYYAAPEQFSKKFGKTGIWTDIWQLGVIFYQLITGGLPFKGDDFIELMTAITTESPVKPTELNPEIDKELENIILKCLNKNSNDRYQSIIELQNDLARYSQTSWKTEKFEIFSKGGHWGTR